MTKGLIALNTALYILLAAAAFETLLSGSSAGWWLVFVVAIYLAASAAHWWWRPAMVADIDPQRRAIVSFFLLLALVTMATWLPGGLLQGVTFLALPTATVLSLVTALGVAVSGFVLFRHDYHVPGGRWLIAALTAYGVFGFLWGVYAGASYVALFHGDSFWSWLPRALQGAFVGALVLIPAALIHEVVVVARRGVARVSSTWSVRRLLGLALTVSLALRALIGLEAVDHFRSSPIRIASSMTRPAAGSGAVVPEVAALARRLENDPAAALRYTADEILFEPYEGVLRGPRGAVLAGAANAADMALLIREILRSFDPGVETRFAFATLPEHTARALLAAAEAKRSRAIARHQTPDVRDDGNAVRELERALDERGLHEVTPLVVWTAGTTRSHMETIRERAGWLDRELADHGVALASLRPRPADLLRAVAAHVWLQRRSGSQWVDLDPTVPDAAPGTRHVEPQRIDGEIPDDMHHELHIGLRLEERKGDQLASRPLLKVKARAAELVGRSITYVHAEAVGLGSMVANKDPSRLTPLLFIGGKAVPGETFADPVTGGTDRPASDGQVAGKTVRGWLRPRASEPGQQPPTSETAQPAALWLEVVLTHGGQETEKLERPVFDRISYVDRASGRLPTARLGAAKSMYGVEDPFSTIWTISTWAGERTHAVGLPETGSEGLGHDAREFIAALEQLEIFHRSYYVLHHGLLAAAARDHHFVPAGVNVSLMTSTVVPAGRDEKVRFAIDLVHSRATTLGSSSAPRPISEGVLWGVSAQLTERLLLRLARPHESDDAVAVDIESIFEQASAAGSSFRVLKPGDTGSVDRIGADREARTRLRGRLHQGFAAVVPERAPTLQGKRLTAWWLIDERRGHVIDELQTGGHSATENVGVTGERPKQTAAARQGFVPRVWRSVKKTAAQLFCVAVLTTPAAVSVADGVLTPAEANAIVDVFRGLAEAECRKKGMPELKPGRGRL